MNVDIDQDPSGTVENEISTESAPGQSGTSNVSASDRIVDSLSETTIPDDIPEFAAGILKGLPADQLRIAVPLIKEWSSTAGKQFEKIHGEYADLKPFKGLDPQEIQEALEMRNLINNNRAEAVRILSQNLETPSQQEQSPVEEEFSIDDLPDSIKNRLLLASEVPDLKEQLGQLLAREQAALTQIENRQMLDSYNKKLDELQEANKELGNFDRDYVNNMVANGGGKVSPEAAVQHYFTMIENALTERLQNHNNAPKVLGGKSIVPVETADVGKMTPKERKSLIVQMLNASDSELGAT